jgi:hypothetical protein
LSLIQFLLSINLSNIQNRGILMSTIKIRDINPEVEDLADAKAEKVNGGDNPGMAPPGAYEYGVTGGCGGSSSMDSLVACLMLSA